MINDYDSTEVIFLILLIVSLIFHMINGIVSLDYESISVNALDETCKKVMNSSYAKFYQQEGIQNEFSCRDGDKFFVVGENKFLGSSKI